jgi:hypothetical protein
MSAEQLERLARRINWLDRYRRALAIPSAAIVTSIVTWQLSGYWPNDWPMHVTMFALTGGVFVWYGIETFYGFLIALWETDYSKLTRPPGLPRAEIVRRIRSGARK